MSMMIVAISKLTLKTWDMPCDVLVQKGRYNRHEARHQSNPT